MTVNTPILPTPVPQPSLRFRFGPSAPYSARSKQVRWRTWEGQACCHLAGVPSQNQLLCSYLILLRDDRARSTDRHDVTGIVRHKCAPLWGIWIDLFWKCLRKLMIYVPLWLYSREFLWKLPLSEIGIIVRLKIEQYLRIWVNNNKRAIVIYLSTY